MQFYVIFLIWAFSFESITRIVNMILIPLIQNKNKINVEVQQTDSGTNDTELLSTRGHIFPPYMDFHYSHRFSWEQKTETSTQNNVLRFLCILRQANNVRKWYFLKLFDLFQMESRWAIDFAKGMLGGGGKNWRMVQDMARVSGTKG